MNVFWYTARAGGVVTWGLLTASVLWGLLLSSRFFGRRVKNAWLLDLHRYLGALSFVFLGVHVVSLMLDQYAHVGVEQVLLPLTSSYRPLPVALGVVSFYLLFAIQLTSLARAELPKRIWRMVHMGSFPLFLIATIHGLTAGTDRSSGLLRIMYVAGLTAVAFFSVFRFVPANANENPSVLTKAHA